MCPAKVQDGDRRGWIIPVGGGEKKTKSSVILRRFVELCGGTDARLVVIPTASQLPDSGPRYVKIFTQLGAGQTDVLALENRTECNDPQGVELLEQATGVFLTGGNQLRLTTTIGGTSVAQALRRGNARGLHIAGTSAGAAFLCEHMIAFGKEGATPRSGMVTLAPGLGLTNRTIFDQHFRERDRLGRLMTALAYNPFATGVGLDEDTAAFLNPDDVLEVVGSGGITIVDPSQLEHSSMGSASEGKPVSLVGIRLHVLLNGARYDLHTRKAELPE